MTWLEILLLAPTILGIFAAIYVPAAVLLYVQERIRRRQRRIHPESVLVAELYCRQERTPR